MTSLGLDSSHLSLLTRKDFSQNPKITNCIDTDLSLLDVNMFICGVCVPSAQHPITLDPRCFELTACNQSNCRANNEEKRSNNAPVGKKMIPKIVSFGYKNYEVVNKKRIAVCKTCGSKITDGDATTSNFVRHLKLHKSR